MIKQSKRLKSDLKWEHKKTTNMMTMVLIKVLDSQGCRVSSWTNGDSDQTALIYRLILVFLGTHIRSYVFAHPGSFRFCMIKYIMSAKIQNTCYSVLCVIMEKTNYAFGKGCHELMNRNVRKRNFWHIRPTKTLIRLHIRVVCSESSVSAWKKKLCLLVYPKCTLGKLFWIFAVRTCRKVRFRILRLI